MMPSDPLTLDALRVPVVHRHTHYDTGEHLGDEIEWVPVTPDMLIEVLEGMGATERWVCRWGLIDDVSPEACRDYGGPAHRESGCGPHLVLPLPTPQGGSDE